MPALVFVILGVSVGLITLSIFAVRIGTTWHSPRWAGGTLSAALLTNGLAGLVLGWSDDDAIAKWPTTLLLVIVIATAAYFARRALEQLRPEDRYLRAERNAHVELERAFQSAKQSMLDTAESRGQRVATWRRW
jgi:hypothetical protein